MFRPLLGCFLGLAVGLGLTALILRVTSAVIQRITAPRVFEIEYSLLYQAVILGASFGALCGTLVGAASAIVRTMRDRSP